jgi:D-sedoheptulose 7-phosphate isomerase
MKNNNFTFLFLKGITAAINKLPVREINDAVVSLSRLKKSNGRLFILGVGGSAANCSHAVNDFRKICNIECYTPNDNIAEISARINDDGWETVFTNWLKVSKLNKQDILMILSVGGGDQIKKISTNIIHSILFAQKMGTKIIGIVSRNGGYTKKAATVSILIPVVSKKLTTAYAESIQGLILHAIVNHPLLKF